MQIDISHIAKLANLKLTADEIKSFQPQITSVITYVERLSQADTKNVQQTSQIDNLENILRQDQASPSLSQEEALANSKKTLNGLFKTEQILSDE